MATENKREEKKHSIAKEPYKSAKRINAKDKQVGKEAFKKAHSEERKEPSNTLNRTKQNNTEQQLSKKMTTQKKREERKHSNTKETYTNG